MKKRRRNRSAPLLWALALAAWCTCLPAVQRTEALSAGPAVRWAEAEGPTPAGLRQAEERLAADGRENLPRATLWRERTNQTVIRPGGPEVPCTLITCWGWAEDLLPLPLRAGSWPAPGDTAGCAVDEAAAMALWGGTGAVGQTILWEDERYTVRGVFSGRAGVVMLQGDAAADTPCGDLLLVFPNGGSRAEAEAFLTAAGLSGGAGLDLPLLSRCLGAASELPAGLLLAGIWLLLLRRGRALGETPLLLAGYLPWALLCAGAALWAAGFPWRIPAVLLPSRWSDFSFWPRLLGEGAQRLSAYCSIAAPGVRDGLLLPAALAVLLPALAAAGLTGFAALRTEKESSNLRCLLGCGAWMAGLFLTVWGCSLWDGGRLEAFTPSRGMWLLPPLWLAVRRLLALHAEHLKPKGGFSAHDTQEAAEHGAGPAP